MAESGPTVRELLNAQTGQLGWPELARHFARGAVVRVAMGEDLIEVAAQLVEDDSQGIVQLHEQGRLDRADDSDAIDWQKRQPRFWAVVVAPWVLVQEIDE